MREPESTDFIAAIPTVWDESIVLDGKMGEYIVTARRKGDVWYIAELLMDGQGYRSRLFFFGR